MVSPYESYCCVVYFLYPSFCSNIHSNKKRIARAVRSTAVKMLGSREERKSDNSYSA